MRFPAKVISLPKASPDRKSATVILIALAELVILLVGQLGLIGKVTLTDLIESYIVHVLSCEAQLSQYLILVS